MGGVYPSAAENGGGTHARPKAERKRAPRPQPVFGTFPYSKKFKHGASVISLCDLVFSDAPYMYYGIHVYMITFIHCIHLLVLFIFAKCGLII